MCFVLFALAVVIVSISFRGVGGGESCVQWSSWSPWAFVVCVVSSDAVGLVVVVAVRLSLPLSHGVPCQAVLCRSEHVVSFMRSIVISLDFGWLQVF